MAGEIIAVEWREIPGWPGYRVSSDGQVQSRRTNAGRLRDEWRPIKSIRNRYGYPTVVLCLDGRKKCIPIHTLLLITFVGPRPEGLVGCHANDIKTDNRLENLRWDSQSENIKDIERNGGRCTLRDIEHVRGEENGLAKLTDDKVRQIRRLRKEGRILKSLADEFGVCIACISQIVRGVTWKHVEA